MTPKAQRLAIAEACGWKDVSYGVGPNHDLCLGDRPTWSHGKIQSYLLDQRVPDYLNDLNAMHEAEKHLRSLYPRDEFHEFGIQLEKIMTRDEEWVWHATASQRAEAFLRTLGLWEETK
jgi:hypothetical protein